MGKVSIHADTSRALRKALGGITQAELAAKLLVSRNYISQIEADLKTPSPRLVAQMENLLTEAANGVSKSLSLGARTPGSNDLILEEDGPSQMVASRITPAPGAPSTRADCEEFFAELLDAAERSGNPNAFPVIYDGLINAFPIAKWKPKEPGDSKQ